VNQLVQAMASCSEAVEHADDDEAEDQHVERAPALVGEDFKASIDQLIQAMAGFNPQALGAVSTLTDLPQSVPNTITASWHIYRFNIGDGADTIDNQDSAGTDKVIFGTGIEKQDLWFQQKNYDLTVQVLGTSDSITLQNWFVNDAQKVDQFALSDGEKLDKASVDQLIQAMAGFNPQALGAVSAITDLPQSVQNTIAASWHT
jgi:hypothetical protein